MNFIPFAIGILIGLISIMIIFLPATQIEQNLWSILRIRKLHHWVTKHKTVKSSFKKDDYNLIEISQRNVVWHVILTFIFSLLMFRAQYTNDIVQSISHILLVPILAFFPGSIIQRQKIVVLMNRKNSLTNTTQIPNNFSTSIQTDPVKP